MLILVQYFKLKSDLLEALDMNSVVSARVGERSSMLKRGLGELAILKAALLRELSIYKTDLVPDHIT